MTTAIASPAYDEGKAAARELHVAGQLRPGMLQSSGIEDHTIGKLDLDEPSVSISDVAFESFCDGWACPTRSEELSRRGDWSDETWFDFRDGFEEEARRLLT